MLHHLTPEPNPEERMDECTDAIGNAPRSARP